MAVIIPISTKTAENPLLKKLKALDKIRAEKAIAKYNKKALHQQGN